MSSFIAAKPARKFAKEVRQGLSPFHPKKGGKWGAPSIIFAPCSGGDAGTEYDIEVLDAGVVEVIASAAPKSERLRYSCQQNRFGDFAMFAMLNNAFSVFTKPSFLEVNFVTGLGDLHEPVVELRCAA